MIVGGGAGGSTCAVCWAPGRIAAHGTLNSPAVDEETAVAGATGLTEAGAPACCERLDVELRALGMAQTKQVALVGRRA